MNEQTALFVMAFATLHTHTLNCGGRRALCPRQTRISSSNKQQQHSTRVHFADNPFPPQGITRHTNYTSIYTIMLYQRVGYMEMNKIDIIIALQFVYVLNKFYENG